MSKPTDSITARIRKAIGLDNDQLARLMPHGPASTDHFVSGIVEDDSDERTWAEKEYEKDMKGWKRV